MRKSFLTKAVVAVGVMVSAMALSSIAVFAATSFKSNVNAGTFDTDGNADLTQCTADKTPYTFGTSTDSVKIYTDAYDTTNSRVKVYGESAAAITIVASKPSVVEFTGYTSSSGTARTIKNNSDTSNLTFSPSSGFSADTTGETLTATVAEAGTYTFNFSGNVQLTGLKMTEKAASASGKVSLTINGTGTGNASVTVNGEPLNENTTYDGDSEVILTVSANSDSSVSFTVNNIEETLTNGSYTTKVDNNISFVVTFTQNTERSAIVESRSVDFKNGSTGFGVSGKAITTEHFFTLGSKTSLGNSYATVSGTNSGADATNGITFNTGDLDGKTAKIKATFASGSDTSTRELMLYGGTEAQSFGTADNKTLIESTELELESNKTYIVSSKSSNMYVSNLTITVTETATTKVSDSLAEIKDLSTGNLTCSAKYAKVDGTHYLVLDFTKNDALKNASALTYSVSGQADKTISELYTGVQFDADGKDVLSAEDHLYYAFKFTDTNEAYTNLNATISIAD